MIHEMCKSAKFPKDHIYRMCVASNTTMNHLFAGINADPLSTEPYIPAFFKTNSLFASDVGVDINKDAHIIMAANVGSYVGGDITAGTLVSRSGTPGILLVYRPWYEWRACIWKSGLSDEMCMFYRRPSRVVTSAVVCVLQTEPSKHVSIAKTWSRFFHDCR